MGLLIQMIENPGSFLQYWNVIVLYIIPHTSSAFRLNLKNIEKSLLRVSKDKSQILLTPLQLLPSKGKELNVKFCSFFVYMSHCSVWFLRKLEKREEIWDLVLRCLVEWCL